jgi:HME family heavy-metal exporter
LVFLPVFAIPGLEGQLFAPLGIAYIVSILSSLLVSITVTPVLSSFMLPKMSKLSGHQSWLILKLKNINGRLLNRVFDDPGPVLAVVGIAVFLAIAIVPTLPRAFLPPFNEGSLMVGMTLDPGISLEESARIGRTAELLLQQIPEVRTIGRRTGRSESDEHSLGVHETEFEISIELAGRRMETVMREVRSRLGGLPGNISVGQPISHRLIDHILTGTPGQLAVKIFGDDLDVLRNLAGDMNRRLSVISGVVDLEIEKQMPVPQIQIRVDPRQARLYGVQPGPLTRRLAHMINGATVSQIVDGVRYFDVVIRLDDIGRDARSLAAVLIDTDSGPIPLSHVAKVHMSNGPNQVLRENGRRRILITANGDGANDSRIAVDVRQVVDEFPLPTGYFATFEGIYAEQNRSALRLLGLAAISLSLIFAVLYTRYRSVTLAMIIMCNVPLSLIGCVLAVKLAGLQLSVASMIGFITLTGISTRNGILKISHFINLVLHENETFGREMILRGSQERLVPVLMTATSACFGLLPLLILPNAPGKEILYPVAVVIFGGLLVATFLDSLLTPLLFLRFGRSALERLASQVRAKPVIESF